MKLIPHVPGALLLALLLSVPAAAPATASTDPGGTRHRHTAAEIGRFLSDFYGQHGPSWHNREHRVSQLLKDKQLQNPAHDVLLCAQNEPETIEIGTVTVAQSAGVGWATVTTRWGLGHKDTFTAYVLLESRPIRLDDVICAG